MVFIMLKFLLYPNQEIYIISSVGSQAQEAFLKMEKIAKQQLESIPSLKDIFFNEVVKGSNSDGFIHDKSSFKVKNYGGCAIYTLNSKPDNVRSHRATLVFFDESSFCSEELISAALPFLSQDSNFKVSTDKSFNLKTQRKLVPNQVVFASSAGDVDSYHYRVYKEYAMKMLAGDSDYFCMDAPCDVPLQPYLDGDPHPPLLTREKIDQEMRTNPDKAKREYYNKFTADGGASQIIKWANIRRNEKFTLPQMGNENNEKFAIAFDPARSNDNSIISVMKILYDEKRGYYGQIVNCTNLIDLGKKRKMQMKTPDQMKYLKQTILDYNGDNPDYENIKFIGIDAGAGGSGVTAYADYMLDEWTDKKGEKHKGFIDDTHDLYKEDSSKYPKASRNLRLISPQKYRTQMVGELIELMNLDLIEFPKEYHNKGYVNVAIDDDIKREIKTKKLSLEEQMALINIDTMKSEITSIHEFKNSEGVVVRYSLPKEKEKTHHDDRFYTIIMLAHYLYEIRRKDLIKRKKKSTFEPSKLSTLNRRPTAYNRR